MSNNLKAFALSVGGLLAVGGSALLMLGGGQLDVWNNNEWDPP